MARTTTKPRLSKLVPAEIAADVEERVERFLGRLAAPLSPGLELHTRRHGDTGIALTASALCEYAQRGVPVWDWESWEEAEDACAELVATLWGRIADAGTGSGDVGPLADPGEAAEEADLDDPLALVLVAAWARVTLAKDEPVMVRQLAALAGLDPDVVRRMADAGELALSGQRPRTADAGEARRWLSGRGVKGL